MKKIIIILICFVSIFSLLACDKKSELELFFREMKTTNKLGVFLNDGWYEVSDELTKFYDDGRRIYIYRYLAGDFVFENDIDYSLNGYEGYVEQSIYKETIIEYGADSETPIKMTKIETITCEKNVFRSVETTINGEVVERYTEGSNEYNSSIYFTYECDTWYQMVYSSIYQNEDFFDENIKEFCENDENMIVKDDCLISFKSSGWIDTIHFDESFGVSSHSLTRYGLYNPDSNNTTSYLSIIRKCNECAVEVPSDYEKELKDGTLGYRFSYLSYR